MSFFTGLTFFIVLFLALIPAILLGIFEKNQSRYTLLISVFFILAVFSKNPTELLYFICYLVIQLTAVRVYLLIRTKNGRVIWQYRLFLLISLLPLVLNKAGSVSHLGLFGFIGISYITFRSVQVIIEIYDGVITEINMIEFLSFLLFFPSISSGPIDRCRRFHEDYVIKRTRQEYLELLGDGLFKIMLGLVYKFVLAMLFAHWMSQVAYGDVWYATVGYVYCYGFNLFFDFAGYSLMAVGTGYILGVCTPDNFKFPFISKDIKDFWDRWHITLSHWFRDFIFSRFMMESIRKKRFKTRLNGACAGFIVNMLVMGAWHGLSPSYLLYGVYHGVLLALTETYQKKSKFYKKNKNNTAYKIASWFLTLQFVMYGFYIFSGKFING